MFVTLLRRMMRRRSKPVHLVVDGLPAHKTALVKAYAASTKGMLTLHCLPGYARHGGDRAMPHAAAGRACRALC
jgi:hypothetical protein